MAQREILTLNESTPQLEAPQAGDSYLAPVTVTASSGDEFALELNLTVNQSGTAGYRGLYVNVTETATGSGGKNLADFWVSGARVGSISNEGLADFATLRPFGSTVANLPSPLAGMIRRVTDADGPTVGSTVAGGGAEAALVWYDGSNWIVLGKPGLSDHTLLSNVGTNTHAQIDTHIGDATLHFTEASIDHTAIQNVGTNTHAQIDTHISDTSVHFPDEAPLIIAASDETTDLTTGTAKVTFRMPYAMTLSGVRASVTTAPTGSTITVDINESGASILSTLLTIDAGEKTSTTAATPPVISDSSLADDAEITIDIDQVGSTVAGAGLKVYLLGTRA